MHPLPRPFRRLLASPLLALLLAVGLLLSACDDQSGTVEQRTTAPDPVTDFQAEAGFEEMHLAWVPSESASAEGTVVFQSESADFPFLEDGERVPLDADKTITSEALDHQIYQGDAASIIAGGLTNDQTYYYAAFAYRGESAYSAGRFAEGTPPGLAGDEGSLAQPLALDLGELPRGSSVSALGSSYYAISGMPPGGSLELRVTGSSGDVTLRTFADADFSQETCLSDASGLADEKCDAPTHAGVVWLQVDDVGGFGATFTLQSALGQFGPQTIPFTPEPAPFANSLVLADDGISAAVPIGFPFRFFGNDYTSMYVVSNGYITFDSTSGLGCCRGGKLPDPLDDVNNVIALAWDDLNPPGGGSISWEQRGSAPNRRLIVSFESINWCCESGQNRLTGQIILHENNNAIDLMLGNLTQRPPGAGTTQGVENADGTMAFFLPGRVDTNFGVTNDAVRFFTPP